MGGKGAARKNGSFDGGVISDFERVHTTTRPTDVRVKTEKSQKGDVYPTNWLSGPNLTGRSVSPKMTLKPIGQAKK